MGKGFPLTSCCVARARSKGKSPHRDTDSKNTSERYQFTTNTSICYHICFIYVPGLFLCYHPLVDTLVDTAFFAITH